MIKIIHNGLHINNSYMSSGTAIKAYKATTTVRIITITSIYSNILMLTNDIIKV